MARRSGWRDRRRSGEATCSAATAAASRRFSSRRPVLPAVSRVLPASRLRKQSASRWRTGGSARRDERREGSEGDGSGIVTDLAPKWRQLRSGCLAGLFVEAIKELKGELDALKKKVGV
jgi:hypothetical protein